MGTSWRRTIGWLILAALAIASAALFATGGGTALGTDVGARPGGETGELKIVKNLGGGWPDGAFIFTWDCTDGQSGQATFPDDFTGANLISPQQYPLGTVCTVEETDGVLSVDDYDVATSVEGSPFEALNPRDVPINNSVGLNTIQYKNVLGEPEPQEIEITKHLIGGPLLLSDFEFEILCNPGDYQRTVTIPGPESSAVFEVPGDLTDCTVTETPVQYYQTTGDNGAGKQLSPELPTEWVIINTYDPPEPEQASVTVKKIFEGPAWEFGFVFACESEQDLEFFSLTGGGSTTFDVGFDLPYDGDDNGIQVPCTVAEEALLGAWTVTFEVDGAAVDGSGSDSIGTFVTFPIEPGDEVVVTFTNIPGYAAQPPSGVFTLPDRPVER